MAIILGCSQQPAEYRSNTLHVASVSDAKELKAATEQSEIASQLIAELFGTADAPKWPLPTTAVVEMEKVARCAGPVGRAKDKIERGLFRKHCVQCHGITGDGAGPAAALLAPYPRDFRRGTFKYKSTPTAKKPKHEDIVRTIEHGLAGTSMPAFGTLNKSAEFSEDVEALSHYVRFLSIRGETERRLISELVSEDSIAISDSSRLTATKIAERVVNDWAASMSTPSVEPGLALGFDGSLDLRAGAIERGKSLYLSELTACSKCHGEKADGVGKSQDFDEWTKDWTIRAGLDPTKKSEWKVMKKFGALKPVLDRSRNLLLGAFRGGQTRQDIYTRLVVGIEGSPMPAVARKQNGNPGLSDEDIRDLVEYVYSLSELSNPTLSTGSRKEESNATTN